MDLRIGGVYAALLTPRHPDDSIDTIALQRLVAFLKDHGLSSYVVNGATGEFCLSTPTQVAELLRTVRHAAGPGTRLMCGIGGAGMTQVLQMASMAASEGVDAVLVPAPYFFRYQQEDVEAFYREIAARVDLPILLYNLPQFTSGLTPETACRLIRDVPNIVGIKDSSGSLDILRALTKTQIPCFRIIGNDGVLAQAMRERVCDGVVSGVACVLPHLIQEVFTQAGESPQPSAPEMLLQEFIQVIDRFPTPWGLRWAAEASGITPAWSAQPISASRAEQAYQMMQWFRNWAPSLPSQIASSTTRSGATR